MPVFWIYQGFEYARVTQGSEYAWIMPDYAWIYLNMFEFLKCLKIFTNTLNPESTTES